MNATRGLSVVALLILFLGLFACSGTKQRGTATLEKSDERLSFPLDEDTKSFMMALFPFTDSAGKTYLTFQNERKNELLFYELKSGRFLFKIKPEREGPNGVGRFLDYNIQDLDNIYLTAFNRPIITLINQQAEVKERINYGLTSDSLLLSAGNALSFNYKPSFLIKNKMYIISECNRQLDTNPVSAVIDLNTKRIEALPFEYPIFPVSRDKRKTFSIESQFSRIYDGTHFVYSFHYDENVYVTLPDHQSVKRVLVKSRFLSNVKFTETMTSGDPMKNICENPKYGNLFHDPYRKVYYRFVFPENEIPANENYIEHYSYGRKIFSIIILDEEFNILGETLFPEYTYNPGVCFIHEDGLYISSTHFKNPDFDEDLLTFDCFELIYN